MPKQSSAPELSARADAEEEVAQTIDPEQERIEVPAFLRRQAN